MIMNFWNVFGAGMFGSLINLPIVNYFEHATYITHNHAHAAMFGVKGNIGLQYAVRLPAFIQARSMGCESCALYFLVSADWHWINDVFGYVPCRTLPNDCMSAEGILASRFSDLVYDTVFQVLTYN